MIDNDPERTGGGSEMSRNRELELDELDRIAAGGGGVSLDTHPKDSRWGSPDQPETPIKRKLQTNPVVDEGPSSDAGSGDNLDLGI